MGGLLALLVILGIISLSVFLKKQSKKNQAETLQALAAKIGFSDMGEMREGVDHLLPNQFRSYLHGTCYALRRETPDTTVMIFICFISATEDKPTRIKTVIFFRQKNLMLPAFRVYPKQDSFSQKLWQPFRKKDANFPDIEPSAEFPFPQHYILRGREADAIRRIFNTQLLALYCQSEGLATEADRDCFLIAFGEKEWGCFLEPELVFIRKGFHFFNLLTGNIVFIPPWRRLDLHHEIAAAFQDQHDTRPVDELLQALASPDRDTCWNAIIVLGQRAERQAVEPLLRLFADQKTAEFQEAVIWALGKIGDARAIQPLMPVLTSASDVLRHRAVEALTSIGAACTDSAALSAALEYGNARTQEHTTQALIKLGSAAVPSVIPFLKHKDAALRSQGASILSQIRWKPANELENTYYILAGQDWEPFLTLGAQAIPTLTQVGEESTFEEVATLLKQLYALIKTVEFGTNRDDTLDPKSTLWNPEVSKLTLAMSSLERIVVDADTYDFYQVERFLTYVVNYIGQDYLKQHVKVQIYGDPDKLHPNLRNSFTNLCKQVQGR